MSSKESEASSNQALWAASREEQEFREGKDP